ncbi:type IV pilin N-terminal domain-containing protein [Methanococcoides orientis]|uniref:type IV pilin n=1 Tax=Methanococcoides orientis TaxID=2822137 RepID=UPI001E4923E9|nr:type IV pilin [Methanococcoides orientis]UGV39758.1 type IV pilin N-terminal domain-containing protein [Methanococcoides orientis]
MFNIKVNEDAVSPVIAEIMMVAIGIIIAAVLAAYALGMGAPAAVPVSNVNAIEDSATGYNVIMLKHQGGDELSLAATNTKMMVGGEVVDVSLLTTDEDLKFKSGETICIFNEADIGGFAVGTTEILDAEITAGDVSDIFSGESRDVKFIDVATQQIIADLDVRF